MAQYSQFAQQFGKTREGLVWPEITTILEYTLDKNTAPKNILDMGCGSGRFFQHITDLIPSDTLLVGIDPCRELLDIAIKGKYSQNNIFWKEGSFEGMDSLYLGQFDIITAIASFHHIIGRDAAKKVVQSILDHLVPNGYFAMTNWNLLDDQYQGKYGKYRREENNQIYYDIPFDGNHRRYVAWDMEDISNLFDPLHWNVILHIATPETEKNIITIVQKKSV